MDIEKAIKTGFERTKEKNGLILIGVFFAIGLVSTIASQTRTEQMLPELSQMLQELEEIFDVDFPPAQELVGPLPLAFESLPPSLVSVMSLGANIAGIVVLIVAFRVFASSAHDKIPRESYSNLLMPTINFIIGFIVFGVVVGIGFFLLIIPGIYLAVALSFFLIFIALEDESFIDSLQSSWRLTKGDRLSIFLLFVVLVVVRILASLLGGIVSDIVSSMPELGALISIAVGSVLTVFTLAVLFEAYHQLHERGTGETI